MTTAFRLAQLTLTILSLAPLNSTAFVAPASSCTHRPAHSTHLHALDPVTYLRTEWVSAALCTNQTPRSADKVLQLGTADGRIVNFVPRTVRQIITSSAEAKDSPEKGGLSVSARRQLKQAAERRSSASVVYSDQAVDDLKDTPSSSVDVVISFQAADRMVYNGYDWKRAIREAGRVLKPGGRFLFVESAEVGGDGESFLEEVMRLSAGSMFVEEDGEEGEENDEAENVPADEATDETTDNDADDDAQIIFSEVGFDNVDLVLQPHVAGVAIKALDADLTAQQRAELKSQEEQDRLADLSLNAFERGSKKRRRKKVKKGGFGAKEEMGMK